MTDLIVREFAGHKIRHRADGFMSLTDMCDANGKLFGNWNKLQGTKEYLKALQDKHYSDQNNGPIESNVGGSPETTGTWGDRRVAMRLAQWLSPEFAIQVDEWIVELMTKGSVSIAPHSTPAPTLPETSLATYADLIVRLGYQDSPILKSVLEQRLAEELGSKALPSGDADRPILLTVRAHQLGIPQKRIGTGSALGKYIKALGFEPLGKSQHGKYAVNSYTPTDALDRAILDYYGDAIDA